MKKSRGSFLGIVIFALIIGAFSLGRNTAPTSQQQTDPIVRTTAYYEEIVPTLKPTVRPLAESAIQVPTNKVTMAPTQKAVVKATQEPKKTQMVYVSRTGKKYHFSSTCSNMKDPYYMSIEEAKDMGRTACSKCAR